MRLLRLSWCISLGLAVCGGYAHAQAPAQETAPVRSFVAAGSLTPAARERLQKALTSIEGVDKVEFTAGSGSFAIRITGRARPNAVTVAAMAAGFDFRPPAARTFTAAARDNSADPQRLRQALVKLPGAESVEVVAADKTADVRVQGDVKTALILSAARAAGYDLRRSLTYAASGPGTASEVARLRESLAKTPGVERVEVSALPGGATVSLLGALDEESITASAKAAGYSLTPLALPALIQMFDAAGLDAPGAEAKLDRALKTVPGIGEYRVMELPVGMRLGVRGGTATNPQIIAAAQTAGVTLTPAQQPVRPGSESERNTPPAYNERVNEDTLAVGDLAPDFTLIGKDGSSRVRLSENRGKRPVVLIFGSYT